jgi:hypothetical protein
MVQHWQDTFEVNFDWQQGYYGKVRSILRHWAGVFVDFSVAPEYQDQKQATDFVMNMQSNGASIACRIRRNHIRFRDFTIRCRSLNGGITELEKLKRGFASWYLYCWEQKDGSINKHFMIIDMNRVRETGLLEIERRIITNTDSTQFIAIDIQELRANDCIIVSKGITK